MTDLPVLDELERALISACYDEPAARQAAAHRTRGRTGWRARPRRVWVAVGASLGAVAAATLIVSLASESVIPSAADALDRAAAAIIADAAGAPGPVLAPGGYWYTRTLTRMRVGAPDYPKIVRRGHGPATVWVLVRQSDEVWIGADGTMRRREIHLSERFASAADAARARAMGTRTPPPVNLSSDTITGGDNRFPPNTSGVGDPGDGLFTYAQLQRLPTTVPALRAALARAQAALDARMERGLTRAIAAQPGGGGAPLPSQAHIHRTPAETADQVLQTAESLMSSPVPASVRAALYRLVATLPGVRYDGPARDALGRPGVAVSIATSGEANRMIFDPRTGALLGESSTTRLSTAVVSVVAAAAVRSVDAVPAGLPRIPAPGWLHPQVLRISPRIGRAHTTFTLTLAAAPHVRIGARGPIVGVNIEGPTAAGCQIPFMQPNPQLARPRATASPAGPVYRYRMTSTSVGDRAWCRGRYQLYFTPFFGSGVSPAPGQTAGLFFEVR
jgi:hypothetical protein